jgi:hypothetical protein
VAPPLNDYTDQGEGKDRALRRVLSLPLDPLSLPALGLCCLRRTGALPLTPTMGSAPGPRLGSLTLRTLFVQTLLTTGVERDAS